MAEVDAEEFLLPLIYVSKNIKNELYSQIFVYKIKEEVPNQTDEIQILAGKSLVIILQKDVKVFFFYIYIFPFPKGSVK